MLIRSISHRGLCPQDRTVEVHPRTMLVGPNGAGKSTLLRAVQIGFGSADPPKGALVELDTDQGLIRVQSEGRSVHREGPRVSQRQLLAVDTERLAQSADSAGQLFAQLAEESIDKPAVIAAVQAAHPAAAAPTGPVAPWLGALIDTLESEARSESARSGQLGRVVKGETEPVEGLIAQRSTLEAEIQAHTTRSAELSGEARALRCELQPLPAPTGAMEPGDADLAATVDLDAAALRGAQSDLAAAQVAATVARKAAAAAREAYDIAAREFGALRSTAVQTDCPTCKQPWAAAAEHHAATMAAKAAEVRELHGRLAAAVADAAKWGETEQASLTAKSAAAGRYAVAREAEKRIAAAGSAPRRAEIEARLAQIAQAGLEVRNTLDALTPRLSDLSGRVKVAQDAAAEVAEAARLKESSAAKRAAVAALREIRAGMGGAAVDSRLAELTVYMGAPCRLSAEARGKQTVEVEQGGQWLPWSSLSDGQRIRFAVAMILTLAPKGLVLTLDRCESLDLDALDSILALLDDATASGELSQVILASTRSMAARDGWVVVGLGVTP